MSATNVRIKLLQNINIYVLKLMTFCSVSLIAIFIAALGIFIFREPSKAELNKFEKEDQERFNWSKMGF